MCRNRPLPETIKQQLFNCPSYDEGKLEVVYSLLNSAISTDLG